jgi:hypothetical protein
MQSFPNPNGNWQFITELPSTAVTYLPTSSINLI